MATPPSSPGQGASADRPLIGPHIHSQRHLDKHAFRPQGSRHGSDWLSKLHRRHDAKHHASRGSQEEQAPLLAQANDDHDQGSPEEVRPNPGLGQSRLGALKRRGTSKAGRAALAVKKGARATGNAMVNGASKTHQTIRENPKTILSLILMLLLLSNIAIGTLFGIHLLTDKEHEACTTPSCIGAADNLLQNLSPQAAVGSSSIDRVALQGGNVDPCTDFDKYVCGGFKDHHDLASDQGYLDTRSLVFTKAARLLRDTVEKPLSRIPASDKAIFKKFKAHYTACMDTDAVSQQGLKPLRNTTDTIKKLMDKHDPVLPGVRTSLQVSTSAHEFDADTLTDALAFMTELGAPALVDFSVAANPVSPSEQVIFASPIQTIGLPAPESYQNEKLVADYRDVTKKTLQHFFQPKINTTNVLHMNPGRRPKLTGILDMAQGVVDLEVKLASITPSKEHQWDMTKSYNKMSVLAFDKMLPRIPLSRFAKALAPSDYKPTSVIVTSHKYFSRLQNLLQSTTKEVLSGFLVWKAVQRLADRIDDPALRPLREFNARVKGSRVDQPPERSRQCINEADEDLSWVTSWFFLQDKSADLKRTEASKISNNVANTLAQIVKKSRWLAKDDAQLSSKKVQAVHQEVGSPKKADASSLDEYYTDLTIEDGAYFANKLAAAHFRVHKSWSQLGKKTGPEWHVTPLSTRVDYDPTTNKLFLPEALLYAPISYESSLPAYALYGSFGAISGHGLSKILGPRGSYFNQDGSFSDPWSEESRKAYKDKAQCFVDQYAKYSVEGPDGKSHPINGKLTLSSNIADSVGANAAFEAWKETEKKHLSKIVPGLGKLTREQVFWIAFGNIFCSTITKEEAVQQVLSSPYAPDSVRIKGTVANSKAFLEAFKCPTKKPTCELW